MIVIKNYCKGSHLASVASQAPSTRNRPTDEAAVVHIVDAEEDARHLSRMLGAIGLGSRSYSTLGEFLRAEPRSAPGCLVVDAGLMRLGSYDPLGSAPSSDLPCPIVMMARGANVPTAVLAMKTGAIDFVEKPLREPDILGAIEAAIRVDRERRLAASQKDALRARYTAVRPRERQVMALVTAGRLNKQIAYDLGLSEVTVKVHRAAVMRKMAARTLADLVRIADALGEFASPSVNAPPCPQN